MCLCMDQCLKYMICFLYFIHTPFGTTLFTKYFCIKNGFKSLNVWKVFWVCKYGEIQQHSEKFLREYEGLKCVFGIEFISVFRTAIFWINI